MLRSLIFANGEYNHPELIRALIKADDYIIGADGGAKFARKLGLRPHIVIGDMDSLSELELQLLVEEQAEIIRFPKEKDETDLELAVLHALSIGMNPILIFGAFGGRLDQTLGNIMLIASPKLSGTEIRLEDGMTEAFFIFNQAVIYGRPGDTVSLVPWSSSVEGVFTKGLAYPLQNEVLYPYQTRSISNEMLEESASVSIAKGLLLCIHIRTRN